MKTLLAVRPGGRETLELTQRPSPLPGNNELRVRLLDGQVYRLADGGQARMRFASRSAIGKVVVDLRG